MPRFAANLTMLFTELPLQQRFAAAAAAGFEGAEILFPYDIAVSDLSRAAIRAGLEIVLINCPPPNWAGGPRGFAAQPGMEDRFRHDFVRALRVAESLRARHIHIMAGKAEGARADAAFLDNLAWAAARAPHASLTIEPINHAVHAVAAAQSSSGRQGGCADDWWRRRGGGGQGFQRRHSHLQT